MRMRARTIAMIFTGAALAASGGYLSAADPSPADIVKTRTDNMKAMGGAAKAIIDQLKTGMPDKAVVSDNAKKIATRAKQIPSWFPKGTGEDSGIKTLAKAEIWQKPDDFKTDADALSTEADKLVEVAATGDTAAIGAQMQATGKACVGCHKPFRTPPPDEPH